MPLKVFGTEVLNPSDLNNGPYSDAVQGDAAAESDTTSGSYGNLAAGAGPSATITLNAGQGCLVIVYATMINQTTTGGSYMAFEVSGAESDLAQDADAAWSNSEFRVGVQKTTWYVAGSTGSHTFTAKYRRGAAGTAAFSNRRILVKKF